MTAKGRRRYATGMAHPRTKITDAQVLEIYSAAKNGESNASITARTGISSRQIVKITSGQSRKAVTGGKPSGNTTPGKHRRLRSPL